MIKIGGLVLQFVEHPRYGDAHPNDTVAPAHEPCESCAIAERTDTGERVLLWLCGGAHWSISRHDPNAERHRADSFATYKRELVGA